MQRSKIKNVYYIKFNVEFKIKSNLLRNVENKNEKIIYEF